MVFMSIYEYHRECYEYHRGPLYVKAAYVSAKTSKHVTRTS